MHFDTETIDRLYLELSQFTSAKTRREIDLELQLNAAELEAEEVEATHLWLDEMDVPIEDEESGEEYSLVGRIQQLLGNK